jgi:hypothetical protein
MKWNHYSSQGAATADIPPYTSLFYGGCNQDISERKAENK